MVKTNELEGKTKMEQNHNKCGTFNAQLLILVITNLIDDDFR